MGSKNRATRLASLLLLCALAAGRAAAQAAGGYALASGDVVRVSIAEERDLSGDFLVGPDGTATFPLIGVQKVTDIPADSLRRALLRRYQHYLRNPAINITPLRRVQVLGEVNRPGVYTVDPTVTLSGAVAMASGANGNGDPRKIRIVRDGRVYQAEVGPAMTLNDADIRSGDQIVVGQKSWFTRNSTFVISVLVGLPTTVLAIINSL
jgi:polysaccharide export outer membrane protein